MSHDAHSGHNTVDAAEVVEPQPIPLAPRRNYLWPLGLSLVVAALLLYFLLFYPSGGNLGDPPAPPGTQTGITTVTVTATAEPSAVALFNPSPTPPSVITPIISPTNAVTTVLITASPTVAITASATIASATASGNAAATPAPVATLIVAAPRILQLGKVSFTVEAATAVSPTWQFNPDPARASWLPTTALPYVVGIPYSQANAALFAAARPGQVVTMQNSIGATLRFQVNTVARVKPEDTSSAAHLGLGMILYLLADPAPDRAMISATLLDVSGGTAP